MKQLDFTAARVAIWRTIRARHRVPSGPLKQQVEVEGTVERVTEEEADAYWARRDRDSQLAAWASHQSEPLASCETLKRRLLEYRKQFDFERQVLRPSYGSGFCLAPERIEFWKTGWRHLHVRVCYQRSKTG